VKANQATQPERVMCRLLRVSASGFYAWQDRPMSARRRADIGLAARIHEIYRRSKGRYGSPNIHAELADAYGIHVGCKRVPRVMREEGLKSICRAELRGYDDARPPCPANEDLVRRQFKADGPNQLWVADATYVPNNANFTEKCHIQSNIGNCHQYRPGNCSTGTKVVDANLVSHSRRAVPDPLHDASAVRKLAPQVVDYFSSARQLDVL